MKFRDLKEKEETRQHHNSILSHKFMWPLIFSFSLINTGSGCRILLIIINISFLFMSIYYYSHLILFFCFLNFCRTYLFDNSKPYT